MVDFKDFADKLQQEVVSDMAESYFGDRKALDDLIATYHRMAESLQTQVSSLNQAAARLRVMLLDQDTLELFSDTLGIPSNSIVETDVQARPLFDSLPFGLTDRGRYRGCLYSAYSMYQKSAARYLNGEYSDDPEQPGRKVLSVNYLQLHDLAERVNGEVERLNNDQVPSKTLRYVKQMDTEGAERSRIIGEPFLQEGCSLDCELKFEPVDFKALKLPFVQDLPELYKVKPQIKQFCKEIYPSRKSDMRNAMQSLQDR